MSFLKIFSQIFLFVFFINSCGDKNKEEPSFASNLENKEN